MKEVTVISVAGSNGSMRVSMLALVQIHQQGRTLDTREVLFPGLVLVYRLQALQAVGPNGVQRLGSLKVCKDRGMNHFRHTNHKAARPLQEGKAQDLEVANTIAGQRPSQAARESMGVLLQAEVFVTHHAKGSGKGTPAPQQ